MAVAVILAVAHVTGAALVDHDHALEEEGLTAERRDDVLGGEDLGRRAVGDQPPVQEGHQLEALGSRLHVVGAHEHGDAPLAQPREEAEDRLLGVHIHAGERLVEQQHVRLLGERPGEEHALLLAAGQLADGALRELGDAELVQTARHHLAVGSLRAAQPAQAAVAPHHHHAVHGDREAPVDLLALGHVGDGIRLAAGRAAVQEHAPAAQGQQADQGLEERRLAGSVGPHDRHLGAVRHGHGHGVEGRPAVVAHGGVLDGEVGPGCAVAGDHYCRASTILFVSNFIMSMYVGATPSGSVSEWSSRSSTTVMPVSAAICSASLGFSSICTKMALAPLLRMAAVRSPSCFAVGVSPVPTLGMTVPTTENPYLSAKYPWLAWSMTSLRFAAGIVATWLWIQASSSSSLLL